MKINYKTTFTDNLITQTGVGEHCFHKVDKKEWCCKCGSSKNGKDKLLEFDIVNLRKKVW